MSQVERPILVARPKMFRQAPIKFLLGIGCIVAFVILAITTIGTYQARGANSSMRPEDGGLAVLAIFALLFGIITLGFFKWWLRCLGESLTVTTTRSILRHGILSKHLNEIWHRDIRNVQLTQGIFQRLMGVGGIGISSAGQSGIEIFIDGIKNPEKIKRHIDGFRGA